MLFIKQVDPAEVKQGGVGICWLYDAIQTLCRLGLVNAPGDSPSGVYKITIFDHVDRIWRPVFLDDR